MTTVGKYAYEKVASMYSRLLANRQSIWQQNYDQNHVWPYLNKDTKLTPIEKAMIKDKWGFISVPIKRGYNYFHGLKTINGFDVNYLPSSYYVPYIEEILNPKEWKFQLANKTWIEKIYDFGIVHPKTIIRSFGGILMDEYYHPLMLMEALELIRDFDKPLLYKPSTDSEQGQDIILYKQNNLYKLYDELKSGKIFQRGSDFVIQELVSQSEETKKFNPSSLNCIRITTLNLNGEISICSRGLKCGPVNSVVDNIGSGKKGVMVGIQEDGSIKKYGFYGNGEMATEHNGVTFDTCRIKHIDKLDKAAIQLHTYVTKCKIMGWDLALNANNETVLIEGNSLHPGISIEQMCTGPIFGTRTNEMIDYLKFTIGGG